MTTTQQLKHNILIDFKATKNNDLIAKGKIVRRFGKKDLVSEPLTLFTSRNSLIPNDFHPLIKKEIRD